MDEKLDIVAIGESVIELSSSESLHHAKCLDKYYAGDVLTSAIAASRMGSKVGYITRVGDDYFKNYLLDSWNNEGLDITQVKLAEEDNGLCLIARPTDGNKEFSYYRKKTAATKLSIEDISVDYIKSSKILYSSGMTQSLSLSAKEAVKKAYEIARENGVTTAYDPNFTKRFMTVEAAKENFDEVIQNVDILFLNSNNDAKNLLEIDSYENIIKYFWDNGVNIVVIKSKENLGYYTGYNGDIIFTKMYTADVVDTTGSGDAFNGGFLHAINSSYSPFEATKFAAIVAGLQARNVGAIKSIPYKSEVSDIFNNSREE